MKNNERSFNKFLSNTLQDMHLFADNSKVMGDPIYLSDNEIIIPINKLTFGFGIGGSEYNTNNEVENNLLFETASEFPYGGASLGGMIVNPEAFLYVKNGEMTIVKMKDRDNIYDKLIKLYKDIVKK